MQVGMKKCTKRNARRNAKVNNNNNKYFFKVIQKCYFVFHPKYDIKFLN